MTSKISSPNAPKLSQTELRQLGKYIAEYLYNLQKKDDDELLTTEKVAELLGWKVSTVYNHRKSLGGTRSGKFLYFSRRNIETAIRNGIKL